MTTNCQSNHGFPPGSDRARCRPRAPTRRPLCGVRPVLGRSNLPRTENLDQLARLLAHRCCSNSRCADSLPCHLSTESLLAKEGFVCSIAGCQSARLIDRKSKIKNRKFALHPACRPRAQQRCVSGKSGPPDEPARECEKLEKSEKCDGISHISHLKILQKCPISPISHISHQISKKTACSFLSRLFAATRFLDSRSFPFIRGCSSTASSPIAKTHSNTLRTHLITQKHT